MYITIIEISFQDGKVIQSESFLMKIRLILVAHYDYLKSCSVITTVVYVIYIIMKHDRFWEIKINKNKIFLEK